MIIQRVILGLLLLLLGVGEACAQAGSTGFAMMKLGLAPSGLAMGDATAATSNSAAALPSNPAAVLSFSPATEDAEVIFAHKNWIQDVRTEYLAGSVPLSADDAVSGYVTTNTISGIEARLRPGPADDTFDSREFIAGVAYTTRVSPDINLGAAVKYLYQRIYINDASGAAFDLGMLWKTPVQGLNVGVAAMNLGKMSPLASERTILPSLLRLGAAYRVNPIAATTELTLAGDLIRTLAEGRTYANAGGEFGFQSTFYLRAGYQFGSDTRGLCAGVGLKYGRFMVDYAYSRLALDLGNGNTFSVAMTF